MLGTMSPLIEADSMQVEICGQFGGDKSVQR